MGKGCVTSRHGEAPVLPPLYIHQYALHGDREQPRPLALRRMRLRVPRLYCSQETDAAGDWYSAQGARRPFNPRLVGPTRSPMRTLAIVLAILSTVFIGAARAQQRPDFAGRWIPAGSGSQPPQPLVVTQTATSITVQNWSTKGPTSGTYQWNPEPEPASATTPRASWQGESLVVTIGARTESWRIDRTGKLRVAIAVRRDGRPLSVDGVMYSRDERQ